MVEKESGIKDLSKKDTSNEFSHVRLMYYKLCTMFMNDWSYNEIRATLDRKCTSTIGVAVKNFKYLVEQDLLLRQEVYDKCYKELKAIYKKSI